MNKNVFFPVLEHSAPVCDTNKALDLAKNWTELDQNAIATPLVSERAVSYTHLTLPTKA